ncbi:hypothetical protein AB0M43_00620 [Longispora sp. NPDC051575]|uniref:hypothetical protein n=1 Tax=Longispora sp. NPDC051575 TaxID=3154943 RepID=UPI003449A37B
MSYLRDSAMTAAVLGFFASSWFGWAQERPPTRWKAPLTAGSVASLLVAAVGAVVAWRNWSTGSALGEPGAMRQYGIIVGVEFGIAALGAAGIALWGRQRYLAPWICLVVGVHFWPMAPVLRSPSLYALGALLTVVALASVPVSRVSGLTQSAVTGAAAGTVLFGFATWGAVAALT